MGCEPSSVDENECLVDDSLLNAFEKLHFLVADRRGLSVEDVEEASVSDLSAVGPRRTGARISSCSDTCGDGCGRGADAGDSVGSDRSTTELSDGGTGPGGAAADEGVVAWARLIACEPRETWGIWLSDDRALRSNALGRGGTGGMSSASSRPAADAARSLTDSPSLCTPDTSLDALFLRTILGGTGTDVRVPAVLDDAAVEYGDVVDEAEPRFDETLDEPPWLDLATANDADRGERPVASILSLSATECTFGGRAGIELRLHELAAWRSGVVPGGVPGRLRMLLVSSAAPLDARVLPDRVEYLVPLEGDRPRPSSRRSASSVSGSSVLDDARLLGNG